MLAFPPFGDHSFLEIRHMSGSGFGDAAPPLLGRRIGEAILAVELLNIRSPVAAAG